MLEFLYRDYWTVTFLIPVIVLACAITVFCASIANFMKKSSRSKPKKRIPGFVFCLFVVCAVAFCELRFLCGGGWWLLTEKEHDAVSTSGMIEAINEPSEDIPGFKINHNYGADIVIDGERYFAVTSGEFEVGDYITISYLPSSRFVLKIDYAE